MVVMMNTNSGALIDTMVHTNDFCHKACGMHKYELLDPYVCSIDLGIIKGCLLSIIDMFAGIDTEKYTIDRVHSHVWCDGTLDVSICTIEEAINNEVKTTPGYGTTTKDMLGDSVREVTKRRVKLTNAIAHMCTYWDTCKMIYMRSDMVIYTFTDEWLDRINKGNLSLDEMEKLIMDMQICDLMNSDICMNVDD